MAVHRWFAGFSRHSVISGAAKTVRLEQFPQARTGLTQFVSLISGSVFIGLGVSLFVHSRLGVPAWDVMLTAMRDRLGLSLGQSGWLLAGAFLLVAAAFGRRPRLNSVVFILANGAFVDLFVALIRDPSGLGARVLFMVLGTVSITAAVALTVHSGLTGGAVDLLLAALNDRGFIDPYKGRIGVDLATLLAGVSLGGDFGVATVFSVVVMGPLVKVAMQALTDHRRGRSDRMGVHRQTVNS